ncbi:gamma-aminobutyric acid receptor-associated protein-like 2 isoform X2 [Oppia nitens]|uniref:gamma-aminobutyric acid receptor-associated protein-like 2 isoform X2 n=1 Tax=Oppia nitens TaxID=1686743 RepID=UPI0023DB19B6|nr:gamma-aminobutyric acid receptor-associated protein-like 2 isoform X2 [Oppia nitens]
MYKKYCIVKCSGNSKKITHLVIIEKYVNSNISSMDRDKFLVPYDCTVSQFQWTIRRRCQLSASQTIFLFVGRTLPQSCALMGEIYQQHRDEDGFLYMAFSGENTFGNN